MSSVNMQEFVEKQRELERLQREMEKLKETEEMKTLMALKKDLDALMKKHKVDVQEMGQALASLDPDIKVTVEDLTQPRSFSRPLVAYKNPHTGEVVKTRGGNHRQLKEWREKYGYNEVRSWIIGKEKSKKSATADS